MNIPKIEELDRIGYDAEGWSDNLPRAFDMEVGRYVTAIRDAVVAACKPQLRPIAKMPAEVPEGCVRHYWCAGNDVWYSSKGYWPGCTHFIDIALPVESYPADFERAFAESKLDAKDKAAAFELWKKGGAR